MGAFVSPPGLSLLLLPCSCQQELQCSEHSSAALQHHQGHRDQSPVAERGAGTPPEKIQAAASNRETPGTQGPLLPRSHRDLASWSIYRCSPLRSKGNFCEKASIAEFAAGWALGRLGSLLTKLSI